METAIQLLTEYDEYLRHGIPGDMALFGEWLKQKYSKQEHHSPQESDFEQGIDMMTGNQLGGLTPFVETWTKLAFQDIPLVSLNDFGILKTVQFLGAPTKKTILANAVMERTTCNEIIKRLIREGVFQESVDQEDRRLRRVQLTEIGKKMVPIVDRKMEALNKLLVGNLTEVEKRSILSPLKKLSEFYDYLYRQRSKEEIKALYKL
ncbi:MAG: MarR family winged helix-turn-helix transcriptional regulator [Bacteroidota bacterium]